MPSHIYIHKYHDITKIRKIVLPVVDGVLVAVVVDVVVVAVVDGEVGVVVVVVVVEVEVDVEVVVEVDVVVVVVVVGPAKIIIKILHIHRTLWCIKYYLMYL